MNWRNRRVLVTGGASFIGSHLVDSLVKLGAQVRIVDDLSSGSLENIADHVMNGRVEFVERDLREPLVADQVVKGIHVVFHLAANHGGCGYLDPDQAASATNLLLDGTVFRACHQAGVGKVVYASSARVYPNHLQTDPREILYLREGMAGPPYDAANLDGWAKLMGEMSLRAFYKDWGMKSACCRYFTVYGPRGVENHAVMAMIARAFVRQNPFVIWGTGEQLRNWTYVDDIVHGTILAAEHIDDGSAVNLGTMERIQTLDAAQEVLRYLNHPVPIKLYSEMYAGPYNLVADNSLAKTLMGWEPAVNFSEGIRWTIDWYLSTKTPEEVSAILETIVPNRQVGARIHHVGRT